MLFKKKFSEFEEPLLPETSEILKSVEEQKSESIEEQKTEAEEKTKQVEKPSEPPLFIKLDRYQEIISDLTQVKTLVEVIKNSLTTLSQLEKARADTMEVIRKTLEKISEKISTLDNELVKPTGFISTPTPEYHEIQSIETTIAGLKGQIEKLKAELKALSS